ncbi:MAG TPA: BTAD domain-containing putative transcriptional regulator [Acidimicrobiales bacterium]|nr:BTAD domain-containing putative transcriptional regulator [Acidimicrobiales bacterium]
MTAGAVGAWSGKTWAERLPRHHVPRSRLTERAAAEQVVIVEAGAGYGKSVLAQELIAEWRVVPVEVLLDAGGVSAAVLAGRLRAAVTAAGLSDSAGAMTAAGDDPAGVVDAMVSSLSGEACCFVIDDAHNALPEAGALIDRIEAKLCSDQRLLVLGRRLPPGAERLGRSAALRLTTEDLALRPDETLDLCRKGFGLDVTPEDTRLLDVAVAGWTAAAVLAASQARNTDRPLTTLVRELRPAKDGPVAALVDDLIEAFGSGGEKLASLSRIPLVDARVLCLVTGQEGAFERALQVGWPFAPTRGHWWHLPGPIRDHLTKVGWADPQLLASVGAYYDTRGELAAAVGMLLAAGEAARAAELLAGADAQRAEAIDALELLAFVEQIPPDILDGHPRALFHAARACGMAAMVVVHRRLLSRLDAVVTGDRDPELRRAVDAELAISLGNSNSPLDAIPLCESVLRAAGPSETLTRARALTALGQATCFRRNAAGEVTEECLAEAAGHLEQATRLYLSLGFGDAVSGPAIERSMRAEFGRGRAQSALSVIDDALSHVTGSRRTGRLLFYRAQILTELGHYDEASATLEEVLRLARHDGGGLLVPFVAWQRMVMASQGGDAAGALDYASEVETHRGDWWVTAGPHFMAEAADSLDRVGATIEAEHYLRRAQSVDPSGSERIIAMAECALLARHGDPDSALEKLARVRSFGVYPRELWRVLLFKAYSAWRRGDPSAGALAASAFQETARLGEPQLPLIREAELTAALLDLAVESGSAAAAALQVSSHPVALTLFGTFNITRGGRAVPLGTGQATQLVKMVAVAGGRLPVEQAIEGLWPEVDPDVGRNRLRTVLNRLRESVPEALHREGEMLALDPGVRSDLWEFHRDARRAIALAGGDPMAAVSMGRAAIARYRGDLLPDDLYADWAEGARRAAQRTLVDLLDLCARAAAERGDLDEARRLVERAMTNDPYEPEHYMGVVRILGRRGQHGGALSVLRRAAAVLGPLGIDVPSDVSPEVWAPGG